MVVRNTFKVGGRWDSYAFDCSYCAHFEGPTTWPDIGRVSRCGLHKASLDVELGSDGFKLGEWFCRDFKSSGDQRMNPDALYHLQSIKYKLKPKVLYGFYGFLNLFLKEHRFTETEQKE